MMSNFDLYSLYYLYTDKFVKLEYFNALYFILLCKNLNIVFNG